MINVDQPWTRVFKVSKLLGGWCRSTWSVDVVWKLLGGFGQQHFGYQDAWGGCHTLSKLDMFCSASFFLINDYFDLMAYRTNLHSTQQTGSGSTSIVPFPKAKPKAGAAPGGRPAAADGFPFFLTLAADGFLKVLILAVWKFCGFFYGKSPDGISVEFGWRCFCGPRELFHRWRSLSGHSASGFVVSRFGTHLLWSEWTAVPLAWRWLVETWVSPWLLQWAPALGFEHAVYSWLACDQKTWGCGSLAWRVSRHW